MGVRCTSSEHVFPEGPDPIAVPMFIQSIDCSALAILSSCYSYGAADSKSRQASNGAGKILYRARQTKHPKLALASDTHFVVEARDWSADPKAAAA